MHTTIDMNVAGAVVHADADRIWVELADGTRLNLGGAKDAHRFGTPSPTGA